MAKLINLKVFRDFLQSGTGGGILLLSCVALSMLIANSSLGPSFESFLQTQLGFESGNIQLRYSLLAWINDGLMAIFFLMVGLEIKRELVEGELSSLQKAALPIFAALGGVLLPMLIYRFFNDGTVSEGGWGIPMATDIAFALAIISMLGDKVPASLKIFLAALAIVDDLIAILVIAFFYTTDLHTMYLLYAGGLFALMLVFNKIGFTNLAFYLIPGAFIWYFIHHSGIHATIAGVVTAMAVPTNPTDQESPLEKLEHMLLTPVNFFIMPLFALANTNIAIESEMLHGLTTPLGLGIILGLFLGKPLGITLFSWLSVKIGLCKMPSHAQWSHIAGVGILGGIGFTMSIFIAILSFPSNQLLMSEAKISILVGSIISGLVGYIILSMLASKKTNLKEAQTEGL